MDGDSLETISVIWAAPFLGRNLYAFLSFGYRIDQSDDDGVNASSVKLDGPTSDLDGLVLLVQPIGFDDGDGYPIQIDGVMR